MNFAGSMLVLYFNGMDRFGLVSPYMFNDVAYVTLIFHNLLFTKVTARVM